MPLTQTGIFCQQTDLPLTVVQMNVVYRKNNLFVHYIVFVHRPQKHCLDTLNPASQIRKLVESLCKRIIEQLDSQVGTADPLTGQLLHGQVHESE
jgi:hypothetical protein